MDTITLKIPEELKKQINAFAKEKGLLMPVEIKSAAAFSSDFIRNLEWFQ